MIAVVQALQILAAVLWSVPIVQIAPSIARTWRGTASLQDFARVPLIVAPITGVVGVIYWRFVAHDVWRSMEPYQLAFWAGVWALWCLAAIGKAVSLYSTRDLGR